MLNKIKNAIIIILGFLLIAAKQSDIEAYRLSGKVKSCKEITYNAIGKHRGKAVKGARGVEPGKQDLSVFFNEQGKLTLKLKLNGTGKQVYKYVYSYDNNGMKTHEVGYNSDNEVFNKGVYKYENGNIIDESRYDENNSLFGKFIFHYDSSGAITKEIRYDEAGVLKNTFIYTYNQKKEKTEEKNYLADGTFAFRNTFKYDDKGILIEGCSYHKDEISSKTSYKYDEKNNIIEEIKYNEKGDMKLKLNYKYEYDNVHNWIKKIKYVNDVPKYLTERQIEYYQ